MRVLVVGGGAREHALAWSLARSPRLQKLFIAPGNGGTSLLGENLDLGADDVEALARFARKEGVDLVVVGPEAPLVKGISEACAEVGVSCFGASREAASLEGSKVFAKEFMARHGIPTAPFRVFQDPREASAYVRSRGAPVVVKADGLAQGKGTFVAGTVEEALEAIETIMVARKFGESGRRVVIEEMLSGVEVSLHALCDGKRALVLPSSQDHKRAYDGDRGPNTGGMGAYAPVPFFSQEDLHRVQQEILAPTLEGMASEGKPFRGVLYVGLMMTREGPRVLEYNVRFGDPEAQVLLPLLDCDLLDVLDRAARGELPDELPLREGTYAATVVMASEGYPGSYPKGLPIEGIEEAEALGVKVFHGGTARSDGGYVTSGGRVLAVTAWDESLEAAIAKAYRGVEAISFRGAFWRKDIGKRALGGEPASRGGGW